MGSSIGNLFGGETSSERALRRLSKAPFESGTVQRYLPPSLREGITGPITRAGIEGIGELIQNPGGLSPDVSEAILPRLAAESENIAQNFRGLGSQQAGAAARGNVPISIKSALQSALDVAQERAQRGARREALTDSEQLRRADLGRTMDLLNIILQFMASGKGQSLQGLGQTAQSEAQRSAAQTAAMGSILSAAATPRNKDA